MDQRPTIEQLLKSKVISQRTFDRVKIAKEYIEKKYNIKSIINTKKNEIYQKIKNLNIDESLKVKIINELNQIESQKSRKNREKQTIREYESLKVIGKGAFGEVHVCREIKTGNIYAIKKIKKEFLIKKNQVINIRSEQKIMSKVKSPWIVDLKASFQEDDYLYLVMEYCQGGDFMNLLIKKDILTEDEARFYTAELILAVDSIHKLNCIHRDIKPDNMLIDKYGHIKLSDFGLAKISENFGENVAIKNKYNKNKPTHQKIFSCVGTAYYVAPEVLKKTGYSEDIDWWSVGVIFFEMLAGFAPFCAEETKEVCYKVMNWKKFLKIPDNVIISKEAEDLISRMINNSEERLGKNGVEEIKAHPFFKNIDWDNIRNTKAPFVPELKNDYDTKYFDELDYEEEFYPPKMKFKKRKDIEFLGYTYKEEDELCKEYYDEDDDINKIYNDILEKYKINSNDVNTNNNKSNSIKENNNTNSMQSYSQNNKLKNISSNRKLSVNTEQNLIWSKKKNMIYVKNQNKIAHSNSKNIKKEHSPTLYNKINVNKTTIQIQKQLKPLKTIKILSKKNNLHSVKSSDSSKNKYTKIKLGQNNNLSNKNKIRISPIVKSIRNPLFNSHKRLIGSANKRNKDQDIKHENNIKNIKNNNLSSKEIFKD